MKLILDKDFIMEGDLNSFTLYYHHVSEELNDKGNPIVSKDQWYYPTIADCILSYLNRVGGNVCGKSPEIEILEKYSELDEKIGEIKEFVWNEQNDEILRLREEIKELKQAKK